MSRRGWSTANFLRLTGGLTATPVTIAAWAKTSLLATTQDICGLFNPSANGNFRLVVASSNAIAAVSTDGVASSNSSTTTTIAASTWFHACGVYASSTDRASFLNGGGKGTNAVSRVPPGITRTSIGLLDTSSPGATPFAAAGTGDIAHVAVWAAALSDAEVARLATGISPVAVRREFLVGYWPLDGGGTSEVNVINPSQPQVLQGALSLSAPPPAYFMPKLPLHSLL